MSAAQFPEPAALMPHKQDAVLLDEITLATVDRIEARLVVRDGSAFSDSGGNLPAWVGPEIIAQAIASLAGYRSLRAQGRPAAIGLLLGIRSYAAVGGDFQRGDVLEVDAVESSVDEEGRAVFDGRIRRAGEVVASGSLTVYQPADNSFLEGECARDE
jgi:predicted hotdog family 3-hydroxylacyl-ACP dehydratase